VIAPLVLGVVLLAFGWLLVFRSHPRIHPPGGSFMPVATLASLGSGARSTTLPDGRVISYGLTTSGFFARVRSGPCNVLPIAVYGGRLYVDPAHPTPCPSPVDVARSPPSPGSS